jgi:coenzyme Q-binding protein COQ10
VSLVVGLSALAALSVAAAAPSGWLAAPDVQQRLAAGEVVADEAQAVDPGHPRGWVRAAIRIAAPAEAIWKVMTDCRQAPAFVPGLKSCRRIDGAADGRWEDIEQEVRYSWFLPTVRYVFRAEYERPHRIDFRRVSGDLKHVEGSWRLIETPDRSATDVEYDMYVDPGFWIPQALVVRSLRRDLPAALTGLRERVLESDAAARPQAGQAPGAVARPQHRGNSQ